MLYVTLSISYIYLLAIIYKSVIIYTGLNRVCPKDAYPLLSIDRLVNGAFGFQVLSFLDAYSGYNQIQMHAQDE